MTSAEEEVMKMRLLEERVRAPSIWGRATCGIRFEDLQDKRYEDAVRLLKKHYLPEELTYRSVKIAEDKEATDEFTHNCRIWMKDKMSVGAVKEGTDKLVGLLIMRIQEKQSFSRTVSRVKLTYSPAYSTVMTFYNKVEEPVNLFNELGVKKYLKVYIMMLKARYRHRGIAKLMLKSASKLAESGSIPAISGIFTTSSTQRIADGMGFKKLNEIYYVRYLIDKEIVFWDTGVGNYGAALMAYRIPNVVEPEEIYASRSSRFTLQVGPGDVLADDEGATEGATVQES